MNLYLSPKATMRTNHFKKRPNPILKRSNTRKSYKSPQMLLKTLLSRRRSMNHLNFWNIDYHSKQRRPQAYSQTKIPKKLSLNRSKRSRKKESKAKRFSKLRSKFESEPNQFFNVGLNAAHLIEQKMQKRKKPKSKRRYKNVKIKNYSQLNFSNTSPKNTKFRKHWKVSNKTLFSFTNPRNPRDQYRSSRLDSMKKLAWKRPSKTKISALMKRDRKKKKRIDVKKYNTNFSHTSSSTNINISEIGNCKYGYKKHGEWVISKIRNCSRQSGRASRVCEMTAFERNVNGSVDKEENTFVSNFLNIK